MCATAAVYIALLVVSVRGSKATPQFSRETQLPCISCHTHVPRLNKFGQQFHANGFRIPGHEKAKTLPLWASLAATGIRSGGSNSTPIDWADTKIASAGWIGGVDLMYHSEWAPVDHAFSFSAAHPSGDHFSVAVGRLSLISQFDPGHSISLSQPLGLGPFDPTDGESEFGPLGITSDMLGVRIVGSTGSALPYGEGTSLAVSIPFSRVGATDGLESLSSRPRGVFVEAYQRRDINSYGINAFIGKDGQHSQGLVVQHQIRDFYLQGSAARATWNGGETKAYSVGLDWTPRFSTTTGFRVDFQEGTTTYVPYLSYIAMGGCSSALAFTLEGMIRKQSFPEVALAVAFHF